MRRFALLITLCAAGLTACDSLVEPINNLAEFDMPFSQNVTVPASLGVNLPTNLSTPPVSTNSESVFSSNNTRKDLIQSITLKELTVTVLEPVGEDFSFLESMAVTLKADGLDDVEVASITSVDPSATTITFTTTDTDLKEYVFADEFVITLSTTTDEVLGQDHELEVNTVFTVDANLL